MLRHSNMAGGIWGGGGGGGAWGLGNFAQNKEGLYHGAADSAGPRTPPPPPPPTPPIWPPAII